MTGHQRQILDELRHIEEKHGVKILYACESGSRAWEFPSGQVFRFCSILPRHDLDKPVWGLLTDKG
jgi:hypothetical protein